MKKLFRNPYKERNLPTMHQFYQTNFQLEQNDWLLPQLGL